VKEIKMPVTRIHIELNGREANIDLYNIGSFPSGEPKRELDFYGYCDREKVAAELRKVADILSPAPKPARRTRSRAPRDAGAAGRAAGRGHRWLVGVPMAAALILLSAVCRGDSMESRKPSYVSAPCPNPIFTGIDLGDEFTCGYLTVLENRTRPDGRTIRLAVATRKAAAPNPKPDPIVFLIGGPGGSGLAEGPGIAKAWHRDRDVIFVDTRGALKAHPFLSCPEIDSFYIDTFGMSWSAPETAQQGLLTRRYCIGETAPFSTG
jgi:hypothetical protein